MTAPLPAPKRTSTPSPLTTQLPHLSPTQIAALPYPPNLFPGSRDVQTSYGSMRVYEWGNEAGRRIMLVHGDATCSPLWKTVAEELVGRGCRVICFDLWGRGYTFSPHTPLDSRLLALQLLFAASSSPFPWCTSPFSIIGFSLGGSIALDFTASFPHLVRSVALLAPAGMLRELPGEYADLKRGFGEGVEGEGLRELVKRAVGVRDVDGGDGDGQVEEEGFERLARWQFEEHEGFAGSFASSLFYGPVMGQGDVWRTACGGLRGKRSMGVGEGGSGSGSGSGSGERLVVVCAAEDSVVRPGDVRQNLEGFMEGEEFVFETLPGGHGFLADEKVCRGVVDIVGREWGF